VTPIDRKTAGELTAELSTRGAELMVTVLADLAAYPPATQPETGITYASKIDKAESRIDFAQDAVQAERQVRAFNPAPGAWFEASGERIRIHSCEIVDGCAAPGTVLDGQMTIACGAGAIRPTAIQRAGRGIMTPAELLRGFALPAGTVIA
jgi:methionyl-tRNA formyltransferase